MRRRYRRKGKRSYRKRSRVRRYSTRVRRTTRRSIPRTTARKPIIRTRYRLSNQFFVSPANVGVSSARTAVFNFALTDVGPSINAFFRYFRLTGIKFKFYPQIDEVTSPYNDFGILVWDVNRDDSAVESGTVLLNHPTSKTRRLSGKPFTIYFKPNTLNINQLQTATTAPSEPSYDAWIDWQYASTKYYGIKFAWYFPDLSPTNLANLRYDVTYYIQYKEIRQE